MNIALLAQLVVRGSSRWSSRFSKVYYVRNLVFRTQSNVGERADFLVESHVLCFGVCSNTVISPNNKRVVAAISRLLLPRVENTLARYL